jgi:hypothetical protein
LKAIQIDYGNIVEVKNPVFLKIPLVVGDRWETQPEIDMESMMQEQIDFSGDINLDMKCMIYVIGKEDVNWKGNNVETVRLDERAQAKAKINIEEDGVKGTMSFDMQIMLNLNYLEGIGLIRQKSNLSLTMAGSFSGDGEKITINLDMDSEGNYILSSYNFNNEKSASIKSEGEKSDFKNRFPVLSDNPDIQNKIERCIEITDIIKKVVL